MAEALNHNSNSRPNSSQDGSRQPSSIGIASIGMHLPPLGLDVRELARLREVDPNKYTLGLGCGEMALCPEGFGTVDLAVEAARRAIKRWGGELDQIGFLAVGSESAVDMSRPLSAFVAETIGLRGAVRSYEVKHACYGGTLALRQAVEWKHSGACRGRAALVIAADVALYAPKDPGEPTQGAGAVAFVVDEARIAAIDVDSFAWSEPEFDFWRPVGESFPRVDGPLSLDCYKRAAEKCFQQWVGEREPWEALQEAEAWCFHVPFPKMVKKAALHVAETFGGSEAEGREFFDHKINGTMGWTRRVGNSYTASLWISVAETLVGLSQGARIGAFSYGSGFGSELFGLTAGPDAAAGAWAADIEGDLSSRTLLTAEQYAELRGETVETAEEADAA